MKHWLQRKLDESPMAFAMTVAFVALAILIVLIALDALG